MFFIFYTTQEIHKSLIQKSFNDYNKEIYNFNSKYPNYKEFCVDNFAHKKELVDFQIKIKQLEQIIINNLISYSKNYPCAKVSNHRFIKEYEEFPHRLEQNFDEVLLDL